MATDKRVIPEINERYLRAILDTMPACIVLIDRDLRHRYVNQAYCKFSDKPAEAVLGRTVAEVFGAEAAAARMPLIERALAGEIVSAEGWMPYREGPRYVERFYLPYRADDGSVIGYFLFLDDLTELKYSEERLARQFAALQASEALNTAIIASALDCIIAIDEAGLVLEFNPAAERTFGYTRAAALGRPVGELIIPPELRQRHGDGLARYLGSGLSTMLGRRIEIEAMRADGSVFPVELTVTEVQLPRQRLFTAYLRDLTTVRQAAAEIQRQREALHQSEKLAALGSLLAGVAHELNNPLSIVIGNSLMLAEEAESDMPAMTRRARQIQAAAERCGRIARSFLAMARQSKTQKLPVTVDALVDSVLELLAYGFRSSGIEVERAIAGRLPAVLCDADQINQVLTNLLVNARQALEGEAPPRRVRIEAALRDGAVEIAVVDNGPGIPDAIRSRIFDPFFTTKPVGAGTGIGLAVSRGIAEAHGGSLTLAPSAEGGARFVLRLPLQQAEEAAAEATATSGEPSLPAAPERRALILDDEIEIGSTLADMLAAQGFRSEVVVSGDAARQFLETQDFDVIICDLRLPGIDGPTLYAWMTAHRPHLCARTAFVTGDTLGQAAGRFLASAGRPVLEKPFVPADVRRLVAALKVDGNN